MFQCNRIPTDRVMKKLDEYLGRNDYASAKRHLLYWLEEAKILRDDNGMLLVNNELMGLSRKLGEKEQAMAYMKEKTAYLRGLADGIELGDDKYGKLLKAMIECMDEMAGCIDENEEAIAELEECMDDVCEELDDLDEILFEDDDDEDEEDDEDFECFDDGDFYEVECPHCGEIIYFDIEMLEKNDELLCPNCNEAIPLPELDEE